MTRRKESCEGFEKRLSKLSNENFEVFKNKIINQGNPDHKGLRDYPAMNCIRNELYGWEFLEKEDYKNIEFIQDSDIAGNKSPDFRARKNREPDVLLEVKTIFPSDKDMEGLKKLWENPNTIQWLNSSVGIEEGLWDKVEADIKVAIKQIDAYSNNGNFRKIIYLVISLDTGKTFNTENWDELKRRLDILAKKYTEYEIIYYQKKFGGK
ncbi:MAG: hypothetical protein IIB41_03425 [Candidatus Marinimicrobia bacterium]|nr:hypothetical protein [Candidatus Neomarinimicrobiota bacterium]